MSAALVSGTRIGTDARVANLGDMARPDRFGPGLVFARVFGVCPGFSTTRANWTPAWPAEPDAVARSNRDTIARPGQIQVGMLGAVPRPDAALLAAAGAALGVDQLIG